MESGLRLLRRKGELNRDHVINSMCVEPILVLTAVHEQQRAWQQPMSTLSQRMMPVAEPVCRSDFPESVVNIAHIHRFDGGCKRRLSAVARILEQPDQYRATMMIATTMNAAISDRARSSAFDLRFAAVSGGGMALCWRMQFANEPANSFGFHWIRRYDDLFEVIAFGAVERAKFVSGRPRRDARKHHARLAFRAAESLNCEQRDCGWVMGHCIPPLGQAGAQNSQSPVDAEEGR
jgi:hypothetical protein